MAVNREMEAEILRLFHAEHWRRCTIARQLGIHHTTVTRVLEQKGLLPKPMVSKKSKVDPFVPFINQTLQKYPKLTAARLYQMVKERGYKGSPDYFRHIIARLRPAPKGEAYLRLTTLPGEQAQVDWACFGRLKIGDAERRLLAFVMVLSWSRRLFVKFFLGDTTGNFLRGHVEAFEHFQRIPREILYDNLKSAVIERVDNAIRFNNDMLQLAAHYRFAAKPVPVARPTSKGRVERAISYVRTAFFAGREFSDVDDLNRQALAWCVQEATERRCPGDRKITVDEAFAQEKNAMLLLPPDALPVFDRKLVQVGRTPYVRFDGNDYSVPAKYVRRALNIEATIEFVRIMHGVNFIAQHARSFDRGRLIEDPHHIDALATEKKSAGQARGMTRILNVAPSSGVFFRMAAERGHNMGRLTQSLITMLDLYGSSELETALCEVLANGRIHSAAVQSTLERRRAARGLPPPVPLTLLNGKKLQDVTLPTNSLRSYDRLLEVEDDEQ